MRHYKPYQRRYTRRAHFGAWLLHAIWTEPFYLGLLIAGLYCLFAFTMGGAR